MCCVESRTKETVLKMFPSTLLYLLPVVMCVTKPRSNNGIEYDGTSNVRYQPPEPLKKLQSTVTTKVTIPSSETQSVLELPLSFDVPVAYSQSSTLTESGTFLEPRSSEAQTKNSLLVVVSKSLLSTTTVSPESTVAQSLVALQREQAPVPLLETDSPLHSNITLPILQQLSYPLKLQLSFLPTKDYNIKSGAINQIPTVTFPQSPIVTDTLPLEVTGLQSSCTASLIALVNIGKPQVVSAPCFYAIMRLIKSHQLSLDVASQSIPSNALTHSRGLEVSLYGPDIQKTAETFFKPAVSTMPVDTATQTHEVTASHIKTQQNTSPQSFQRTASQSFLDTTSQSFLNVATQASPTVINFQSAADNVERQASESSHSVMNLPITLEIPTRDKTDQVSSESESARKQTQISTSKTEVTSQSQAKTTLQTVTSASLSVASTATQSQEIAASRAKIQQNTSSQSFQSKDSQSFLDTTSQSFLNVVTHQYPTVINFQSAADNVERQASESNHSVMNLPITLQIPTRDKTDQVSYESESARKQTQISTSKTEVTSQSQAKTIFQTVTSEPLMAVTETPTASIPQLEIVGIPVQPKLTAPLRPTLPSLEASLPVVSTATQSQEIAASRAKIQQNTSSQSFQSEDSQSLLNTTSQSFLNVGTHQYLDVINFQSAADNVHRQASESNHYVINLPITLQIPTRDKTDQVSYESESARKQTQIRTSKTEVTSQSQAKTIFQTVTSEPLMAVTETPTASTPQLEIVGIPVQPKLTAPLRPTLPSLEASLPVVSTATQSQEIAASRAKIQQNTSSQSFQSEDSQSLLNTTSQSFLNVGTHQYLDVINFQSAADNVDRQASESSHSVMNLPMTLEIPTRDKTDQISFESESARNETQISTSKTEVTSQSQAKTALQTVTSASLPVASPATQSQEIAASRAKIQQNTTSQSFLNVATHQYPAGINFQSAADNVERQASESSHSEMNLPITLQIPTRDKTDQVSYESESARKQTQISTSKTEVTSQSQAKTIFQTVTSEPLMAVTETPTASIPQLEIVGIPVQPKLTAPLRPTLPSLEASLPVVSTATQSQEIAASRAKIQQNTSSQSFQSEDSQSLLNTTSQSFLNVGTHQYLDVINFQSAADNVDRQASESNHYVINLPITLQIPTRDKTDQVSYESESARKQTQIRTSKTEVTSQSQAKTIFQTVTSEPLMAVTETPTASTPQLEIVGIPVQPKLTAPLRPTLPSLEASLPVVSTATQSQEIAASRAKIQQNTSSQSFQSEDSQSLLNTTSQSFLNVGTHQYLDVINFQSAADNVDRQASESSHSVMNLPMTLEIPTRDKTDQISFESESARNETQISTSKTEVTSQSQAKTALQTVTSASLPVASPATQSQEIAASRAKIQQNTTSQSFLNVATHQYPAGINFQSAADNVERQASESSHSEMTLPVITSEIPTQAKTDRVSYDSESARKQTQITTSKTEVTSQSLAKTTHHHHHFSHRTSTAEHRPPPSTSNPQTKTTHQTLISELTPHREPQLAVSKTHTANILQSRINNTLRPELTASLRSPLTSLELSLPVASTATQSQEVTASHAIIQQNASSQSFQSAASQSFLETSQSSLNVATQPSSAVTNFQLAATNVSQINFIVNDRQASEALHSETNSPITYEIPIQIKTEPSTVTYTATQTQELASSRANIQQNTSSQSVHNKTFPSFLDTTSLSFLNVATQPFPAVSNFKTVADDVGQLYTANDRQVTEASYSVINSPIILETPIQTKTDHVSYESESVLKQNQIGTSKTEATSPPKVKITHHPVISKPTLHFPRESISQSETAVHSKRILLTPEKFLYSVQLTDTKPYDSPPLQVVTPETSTASVPESQIVDNTVLPVLTASLPLSLQPSLVAASTSPVDTASQSEEVTPTTRSGIIQQTTSSNFFLNTGSLSPNVLLQPVLSTVIKSESAMVNATQLSKTIDQQTLEASHSIYKTMTSEIPTQLKKEFTYISKPEPITKPQLVRSSETNLTSQSQEDIIPQPLPKSQFSIPTKSRSFYKPHLKPLLRSHPFRPLSKSAPQVKKLPLLNVSQSLLSPKTTLAQSFLVSTFQSERDLASHLERQSPPQSNSMFTTSSRRPTLSSLELSIPVTFTATQSQDVTAFNATIQQNTSSQSFRSKASPSFLDTTSQAFLNVATPPFPTNSNLQTTADDVGHLYIANDLQLFEASHSVINSPVILETPIQTKTDQVSYKSESALKQKQISTSKTEATAPSEVKISHHSVISEPIPYLPRKSISQSETALHSKQILLTPEQFSYSLQLTDTKPYDSPPLQVAAPKTSRASVPESQIVNNTLLPVLTASLPLTLTSLQPSSVAASTSPVDTASQSEEVTPTTRSGIIQQTTSSIFFLNTGSQLSPNVLLQPVLSTVIKSESAMVNATQLSKTIDQQTLEASHSIHKTMTSEIPIQLKKEFTYKSKTEPIIKPQLVRSSEPNLSSQSQGDIILQPLPKSQFSIPTKSRSFYKPHPKPLLRGRPFQRLSKLAPQVKKLPKLNVSQSLLSPKTTLAQSFLVSTFQPDRDLASHSERESPLQSNSIFTTSARRPTLASLELSLPVTFTATQSQDVTASHAITQQNTSSQSFQSETSPSFLDTTSQSFLNVATLPFPTVSNLQTAADDVRRLYISNNRQVSEASHSVINSPIILKSLIRTKTDQVSYESKSVLKQKQISTSKSEATSLPEITTSLPPTLASLQPLLTAAPTVPITTTTLLHAAPQLSLDAFLKRGPPAVTISQLILANSTRLSVAADRHTPESIHSLSNTSTASKTLVQPEIEDISYVLKFESQLKPKLLSHKEINPNSQSQTKITHQPGISEPTLHLDRGSISQSETTLQSKPVLLTPEKLLNSLQLTHTEPHDRPSLQLAAPETTTSRDPQTQVVDNTLRTELTASWPLTFTSLQPSLETASTRLVNTANQSQEVTVSHGITSQNTIFQSFLNTASQQSPNDLLQPAPPTVPISQSEIANATQLSISVDRPTQEDLHSLYKLMSSSNISKPEPIQKLQLVRSSETNLTSQSQEELTLQSLPKSQVNVPIFIPFKQYDTRDVVVAPRLPMANVSQSQMNNTLPEISVSLSPTLDSFQPSLATASTVPTTSTTQLLVDTAHHVTIQRNISSQSSVNNTNLSSLGAFLQPAPPGVAVSQLTLANSTQLSVTAGRPTPKVSEPLLFHQAGVVADSHSTGAVITSSYLLNPPQVPVQSVYRPDSFTLEVESIQEPNPVPETKLNPIFPKPVQSTYPLKLKLQPSLMVVPGIESKRTNAKLPVALPSVLPKPNTTWEPAFGRKSHRTTEYMNANTVQRTAGIKKRKSKLTGQCHKQYGLFPMKDGDCSKYIMCNAGVASIMNCPAGLVFNPTIQNCDWLANVPQCNSQTFKDYKCPDPTKDDSSLDSDMIFKYKYGQHCKLYIACQKGYPRLLSCANGQAFDEVSHSCIKSEYVQGCTPNTV